MIKEIKKNRLVTTLFDRLSTFKSPYMVTYYHGIKSVIEIHTNIERIYINLDKLKTMLDCCLTDTEIEQHIKSVLKLEHYKIRYLIK